MASKHDVVEAMYELFQGRRSSYAVKHEREEGGKLFVPDRIGEKDRVLTKEVFERHLNGDIAVGIYFLDENDEVKCAAIDFDGKRGDPLADAVAIKRNLEKQMGLRSWLERSQGGTGVHLWLFFDGKIPARVVRNVVGTCIPEFSISNAKRVTSFDRMFPNQDTARSKYGNLCGIPLNGRVLVQQGRTAFIDEKGNPLPNQTDIAVKILETRNSSELVRNTAKDLPFPQKEHKKKSSKVAGGFKVFSPYGCRWLWDAYKRAANLSEEEWHAALGQFTQLEHGEAIAHKFSKPYPGYSFEETQKKFHHAVDVGLPMKIETVQDKFPSACGDRCVCKEFGLDYPWQVATIPLNKLEVRTKGEFYSAPKLASKAVEVTREIASGKRLGFPWGYDSLDDNTELRPKNLIVVAARRSIGKTACMIDASVRGAERGIPQYIMSIEMSYEEIALRYLARISGVDHTLLITGRLDELSWPKVREAQSKFMNLPIFVNDTTRDLDQMLDGIGEMVFKYGQGCVWVDYLQLVIPQARESKKAAVDRMVLGYKEMSKILDVPVITLAQLNRMEEQAEGDDDLDSWLKDSGEIEQTADVIHYLRGRLTPGIAIRKWRLHKERSRPSGLNFKFELDQSIFKFEPAGIWSPAAELDGMNEIELGTGYETIAEDKL
jgi:replicative DNA helicase